MVWNGASGTSSTVMDQIRWVGQVVYHPSKLREIIEVAREWVKYASENESAMIVFARSPQDAQVRLVFNDLNPRVCELTVDKFSPLSLSCLSTMAPQRKPARSSHAS